MSKKYTIEEVKNIISSKGFELVSDKYNGNKSNIIIMDSDGYYYSVTFGNFKNSNYKKFDKVGISNPYTIKNINLWVILNTKPFILLSSIFEGDKKKLLWQCLKEGCGEIFEISWNSIINNRGCGYCDGKQVGSSNCLATLSPELASEWHPTLNSNLTPYQITRCSTKNVWWQCPQHLEHIWEVSVANRTSKGGTGCPICKNSKGEARINSYLNNVNINSFPEYSFPECKYKISLPFDSYLPTLNVCIEYQGEHHYLPVDFGNKGLEYAEQQFKERLIKDQIKRDYCKANNIRLIEIPYWDFDNIEEILDCELNINKLTTDNLCCFL